MAVSLYRAALLVILLIVYFFLNFFIELQKGLSMDDLSLHLGLPYSIAANSRNSFRRLILSYHNNGNISKWNSETVQILDSNEPKSSANNFRRMDVANKAEKSYDDRYKPVQYSKVMNALTLQPQDRPIPRYPSVTLISQCSKDRLKRLRIQASHWNGPMSVALYLDQKDRKLSVQRHVEDLKQYFSESWRRRAQLTFSFVLANLNAQGYNARYPINTLRNLAVDMAKTEFIFVLDVDFIPSMDTYQILRTFTLSQMHLKLKQAYVVPAFKMKDFDLASLPKDFTEAARQYKSGSLAIFQEGGYHDRTNYDKWFVSSIPYTVKYKEPYEPYVVLRKNSMPRFDERFRGYGRNKIAFVQELAARGYSFIVIPKCFTVHLPHKKSQSRKLMNNKEYNKIMSFYDIFKAEVRRNLNAVAKMGGMR